MSKYKVLNCPACIISPSCCTKYHIDNGQAKDCQDIEDCVIKRVIAECKWETNIDVNDRGDLAERILSEFDIEEINK